MTDKELKQLMQMAQAGDEAAFGRLYEFCAIPVYRYVLLRVRHTQTAEDLTQTVFLKAFASLRSFRNLGKTPLAWLFTIARNCIIDQARRPAPISEELDIGTMSPWTTENSGQDLDHQSRVNKLIQALERLSDEQREVLTLKYIHDLTNHEISHILGKKEDALRQIQSRGIKQLKNIFNQENWQW